MLEQFKKLLLDINENKDNDFSGVGIILYKAIDQIPLYPLNDIKFYCNSDDLLYKIKLISKSKSCFHDGFHLINTDFKLTHVSQYFSPPINCDIKYDKSKIIGGRYMAALFGSCVEDVLYTGIVTNNNGVVIFENGKCIFTKEND